MLRFTCAFTFAFLFLASASLRAQLPSTPDPEHQLLKKFVGQWEADNRTVPEPGQPEMECKGESTAKMIGDLWVTIELQADMQGTKIHALQTIGYDPEKKKYVGTWVDSMINHLWKYEGTYDKTTNVLVMEAEGPNMMEPGKVASYRDSFEFKSPDHIIGTSSMKDDKGEWVVFMKGDLKKKK
jgi:hypothetical protein